jgi:SNF2 family DNA or RNA helicase
MAYEPVVKAITVLNDAFKYSLASGAKQVEQPPEIKVPLRAHQSAILREMEIRERELSRGMDLSGSRLYSRFSFLGDGVGVGKSLMVLGHIARLKRMERLKSIPLLDPHSTRQIYSLHEDTFGNDLSEVGSLIIVPHTLYRQWQTYIKEQTTLTFLGVQTKKVLTEEKADDLMKKIKEADVVLVSNTLYGTIQEYATKKKIIWRRVFLDEADTLHIPSTRPMFQTQFTWLISASWSNLLFPNISHYMPQPVLQTYLNNVATDQETKQFLKSAFQYNANHNSTYVFARYYVMSTTFLREFLHSVNPLRGRLVLRCREDFVKESITLPPIHIRNILCRASVLQRVVANAIPAEVRSLLHAGDVQGALEHLGVKSEDSMSLVKAVTENRHKELDRLRKTYDFKASLEYATPQAKENALKSLKEKIGSLEEQIKQLKERIENYKEEMCPICFDEPQNPTLTPCCSRLFCAACILTSLTTQHTCPLCRATIAPSGLRGLSTKAVTPTNEIVNPSEPQLLKKTEQLLELIRSTHNAKFLVFSRYDNPFLQISHEIESMSVAVKQVRGNKDVIASTLKSFQKGETKVLLLNSIEAGAGLNITAATHIVLLHAMTHEEEKQILGRAYRLGRTEPLEVIRLLHQDELANVHSQN